MKHLYPLALLIGLAGAGPAAAQTDVKGKLSPQPETITLLATGDTAGELTSCNCKVEDYGGLSRKGRFIHVLRESGWEILLIDAGGLAPFGPMDDQKALKVETLAKCMAITGYDAVSLGHRDLALGAETVSRIVQLLEQPVVATNYTLGEGVSVRSRLLEERGRRVGLAAFLDEGLAATHAPWLEVESWEDQKDRMTALAEESDVIVATVQAPNEEAVVRLVGLYPEIDFVVVAGEGKFGKSKFIGGTPTQGAPNQGKYLARTDITWDAEFGTVTNVSSAYLPVLKDWGFRPEIDALIAEYNRQIRDLMFQTLD